MVSLLRPELQRTKKIICCNKTNICDTLKIYSQHMNHLWQIQFFASKSFFAKIFAAKNISCGKWKYLHQIKNIICGQLRHPPPPSCWSSHRTLWNQSFCHFWDNYIEALKAVILDYFSWKQTRSSTLIFIGGEFSGYPYVFWSWLISYKAAFASSYILSTKQ